MKTALYRHFDRDGRLLYVGISLAPIIRLAQHDLDACWATKIARVDIVYFDDREDALAAEAKAIRCERPLYNIVHNGMNPTKKRHRWSGRDEELKVEPKSFDKRANDVSDLLRAYRLHGLLVGTLEATKNRLAREKSRKFVSIIRSIEAALDGCENVA